MHFIPTYSSWLNQVERFFALITDEAIRRGSFTSVNQLVQVVRFDLIMVAAQDLPQGQVVSRLDRSVHAGQPVAGGAGLGPSLRGGLNMHLGQTVRFLDSRDGQMRSGKIVELRDTRVVLHEATTRREWKLPYAAIEPPATGAAPAPAQAARPAAMPLPQRDDLRRGDKVAFEDRYLNT